MLISSLKRHGLMKLQVSLYPIQLTIAKSPVQFYVTMERFSGLILCDPANTLAKWVQTVPDRPITSTGLGGRPSDDPRRALLEAIYRPTYPH